jgi:hypothetical protein
MALIVADRVQETTNSTGTGAYTLGGAVPGFQTFASEVSNADTVYYSITDNVDFEVGLGTYASSGGTITRTTVFTSSNSNNAVNWGIGTKNIFLTYPADKAVVEDASNNVTIGNNLVVGGTVDGRDVAADGTKLDFVTVTQAVNLDQMETDIAALENGMVYKGDWNAGSGSFPGSGSAQTGWFYYVSGAGTVNGISFTVGDNIVATTDNASTSTYASNWSKHDQTDAVQAVVGLTGSVSKSGLLSALNVEDGANVTDAGNVNPLVDSHVNVSSATSGQYLGWNGSDYAWSTVDLSTKLNLSGGTMSGDIDGNGNKMLFANMYSNLVDLPSATTYHGMFAHVHATGKAYFAHSGAWVPLANETATLALSGGTMTGDVLYGDSVKAKFGAGSDLQIFHDGNNSFIKDAGSGRLSMVASQIQITNSADSEVMIKATEDAAVELYHNGSEKLSTTSTGIQVTGDIANASGDLTLDVAGDITFDADGGDFRFKDAGTTVATYANVSGSWYITSNVSDADIVFQGNDGGSTIQALTLDMSEAGKATFNGGIVSNAGVVVDTMTLDAAALTATGSFTVDSANDITLDADGGNLNFKDGGVTIGNFNNNGNNFKISSSVSDKDIIFAGNDNGSSITALTLDMSASGRATFNNNVVVTDNNSLVAGSGDDLQITYDGTNGEIDVSSGNLTLDVAGDINLDADGGDINFKDGGTTFGFMAKSNNDLLLGNLISDGDVLIRGNDGGSNITALTLDMSDAGRATFNSGISVGAGIQQQQNTLTMSGGTSTIDLASANNHYATMTANTTVAFSNKDPGRQGNIIFKQDGTGGRSFTLPAECKTPVNGAAIVQATGANEISVLSYYVLDSNNILVNYIGDFA